MTMTEGLELKFPRNWGEESRFIDYISPGGLVGGMDGGQESPCWRINGLETARRSKEATYSASRLTVRNKE